jgi:type I restriction enzyme S subunit
MTELPKGWASGHAGELCTIVGGATPRTDTEDYWGGGIPWLTPDDLSRDRRTYVDGGRRSLTQQGLDSCAATLVPTGTVLFTSRAPIGYVAIASRPMATNQGFKSLVPSEALSSEFLYWQLRHLTDVIRRMGSGTTFAEVSKKVVATVPLRVAPLREQARIVAAIEEAFSKLDAGEAGLRTVRRLLKRMRDAILSAAVTGRLVPQDPTDTPAAKLLADLGVDGTESESLPLLPENWARTTVGEISQMSLGKMLDAKAQTGQHPTQYLRNINVRWGSFDFDDLATMDIRPEELERVAVAEGDLVVCEGGEPGRCAVWRHDPMVIQKALHRVRPMSGISGDYLALVLAWWTSRPDYEKYVTGTTIKHIPKEKLKLLPVPLPPPEEQVRIVTEVERQSSFLFACERAVDAGLARSAALRRSVLKAAFDGKLVPQDPSDEPASVLLERIRAGRAAASKPARRERKPRDASSHPVRMV